MTKEYHKRRFARLDARRGGYGLCVGLGDKIKAKGRYNRYKRCSGIRRIKSNNIEMDKFLRQRLTITKSTDSIYDCS